MTNAGKPKLSEMRLKSNPLKVAGFTLSETFMLFL